MPRSSPGRAASLPPCAAPLALAAALLLTASLPAQAPADPAAMLLGSARRAYNEKNYPFAAARFREFLQKFGGHPDANAARYGLALCLLDGAEKNYDEAANLLQPLASARDLPEHAYVLYYLGLAKRGQGVREMAQAAARPQEAAQRRNTANQRFGEAAQQFAAAATAFTAKAKEPPAEAKVLPAEWEWAARARCDQAEMLLRTGRAKEARDLAAAFADPKSTWAKSRYRNLGAYYHGFACFLGKDYLAAGRALNRPALFADPVFGTHARYLVARLHHLEGEGEEARGQYEAVIADHAKQKQAAREALRQPARFHNDPDEKARLAELAEGPAPDHVARATFYLAVLLYEGGKFADALARLNNFAQQYPRSPLAAEAQLRQGFCHVQLRQFPEAIRTLQPLADKEPRLADQCLFWAAKAQAGAADPNNAGAYQNALKAAMDTFRRAADKAQQAQDPEARARRGEILLELADTMQLAKQHKEAANLYAQLLNDKLLPQREEELLQRQATALHLAGDYAASDKACDRFRELYPKSTLLPEVLFRRAENAWLTALAAEKNANLPDRDKALAKLREEVIARYQAVVEKYPESPHVNLARYGLAMGHYLKGDVEKAKAVLETIPDADRSGELAVVPYQLADCILRLVPAKVEDDALAANKALEQLQQAAALLEAYANANAAGPQTPDALLKLGHCRQRLAGLLAQPQERTAALNGARTAYETIINKFPQHELRPQAIFERARVLAQAGDVNAALNELRRFGTDQALKNSPVAPMAALRLAVLLRGQNKAQEAAAVLDQCRKQHEQNLAKDPARAGWVPLLQYHHGLALKEAGKRQEARAVFDLVLKQSANRPEAAEAALRWGQSLKDEGLQKVEAARKRLAQPNLKPEEKAAATKALEDGLKEVREAAQYLEAQADQLKQKQPAAEARARMHYEAAWACRALAAVEAARAREKIQHERWQKRKEEVVKKLAPGQPLPGLALPEVPLAQVPVQESEKRARAQYQALVAAFPDLPLGWDARFELAEMMSERGEHDPAIKLLREALDKEPGPELTEKIRLRLGACLAAKGDTEAALKQFEAVAGNPKSPLCAQAKYRAGECHMQKEQWAEAVKQLSAFREQPPFQNVPGLTDRALLRLGHAYAHLKDWDRSRQAHEQVVARFGNGPWGHEARYGVAWALQNQKQYDQAVNLYNQVTAAVATELGAKAQLMIGLCRLEQKRHDEAARALLVVPFTYDYPELSAAALCEAGRSLAELKQPEQAARLFRRVLRDHPDSKWAQVAKDRLEALKGS